MATIKKGVYRLVDHPSYVQGINIVGSFDIAGIHSSGVPYVANVDDIHFGRDADPNSLYLSYQISSSDPVFPNVNYPFIVKAYDLNNQTWNEYFTGLQILTATTDIYVEDETTFTWFSANTELVAETVSASITYDGVAIATVEAGQTKTLKCAGKKMKTDIVITL